MEKISCKIKRFNGSEAWYQEYEVPYEKGKTILWLLTTIREEQDPTLNFTSACRHAICGSCAVRINGNAFLACNTPLDEVIETFDTMTLTFEPLQNFEVVKDLVIVWEPKMEKMKKVKPWLEPTANGSKETGFLQTEEEFHQIAAPTDCILCGVCASECNQLTVNQDGYLEPFILNRAYRFAVDSRDGSPEEHLRPVLENELWKCLHCMQCVSKCPKSIPLTDEIAYLRSETMKMGEMNNQGAKHAYAFHDDVKKKGRLNETMLPIKTDGLVHTAMTKVPFALRMIKKGKINPFHFPKEVEGIAGVRALYEYAKEVKD
ncbi:succinate dehydrogenase / fumarate reductase iron-sulfur subunit [Evansella caseinilytica]|uniref:Fumarate reductase iron-sulfur subunit n=1 Tax=Evansella caseinilytica TaxID=1503961 RepID=A0A1H3TNC2_9BACI|nr:succinate dehydrogenase/fumarate reductase iron-sulfur subunit [Evansella caseinilytica]SDZ51388.1 succinate dehydrogenase / fumarate reductase iron-sulfur subunit [Evansella caseinilytica]